MGSTISEKGGAIFSGSGDNSIKKWDIKTGALMATLEGHADEVTCLAISEKEGAIFSGSDDGSIKKWDIKTGALMATLEGGHLREGAGHLQRICRREHQEMGYQDWSTHG